MCCEIVCNTSGYEYCCESEFGWDEFCVDLAELVCGEAYHVVTAGNTIDDPELTFIERFTIQDGVANGPGTNEDVGAGMLVLGEPGIIRCTFTSNVAADKGCGMAIIGLVIRPILVNCVFYDNPGGSAHPVEEGGGLYNSGGNPQLTNCLFYDNIVPLRGGAIFNEIGACSTGDCGEIDLINCTIADNVASDGSSSYQGGGVFNTGGAFVDAINCIFFDNSDKNGMIESSQIFDPAGNSIVT